MVFWYCLWMRISQFKIMRPSFNSYFRKLTSWIIVLYFQSECCFPSSYNVQLMWRPWHPTFSIHFVCFFEIGTKCRLTEASSSLSLTLRVIDCCCFLCSKSDCQCQLIMLLFCTPCQSLFKGLLDLHVCLSTPNPLIHPAAIQATVQMHKFSQLGQMIVRLHQCCSFSTTLILVTLLFSTTFMVMQNHG